MRKVVTIAATTLGILLFGVVFVFGMSAMRPKIERRAPEITPPAVFFSTAKTRPVTLDVAAQGEVQPLTDISLTAQIAGLVVDVAPNFVNGGAFNKGDLLVSIEDADYRVAVTSARARVAQAEEALRREEAESALARRDYEDLKLGDNPSELALRIPQLAQARANYDAARADVDAAELNLSRTRVRAPFDGRVRQRITGPGQYVAPGSQLGQIFSTDVAEIRLPLTDGDPAKLGLPIAFTATDQNPGPRVILSTVVAGGRHEWIGEIERTDAAIDPTTRQLSAIAVVRDPYGEGSDDGAPLTMGLFVDARIEGKPYANAIVLPRTAVYGRDVIYVIRPDDTIESRRVSVISADKDTVTISGGLASGERYATSPLRGAQEGDKISPVEQTDAIRSAPVSAANDQSADGAATR